MRHFNPIDRRKRNHVQIGRRTVNGIVGNALAVEQHEGLITSNPAHVGEGGASRSAADRLGCVHAHLNHAQVLHDLLYRADALPLEIIHLDDGYRH